ncbi:O-antigen ligase family protein [Flavilitoribacter nigricans]|uniref:O-antigen ligase-related domain-containing protein n=1 Tax=Flavilitoribacter nigricans (strain ATCC 23147 / DSM 23189 / NBRC 102662 / NCIMB 1420 / SS-2) TaxID=1122177 RepID=A0A2D0NK61_FLAN2|nr:O-antigen ligase family protein [Flavilitoribacter nigricans]PHN08599.1 hypothetical protein CRP01_01420 [Flavilitoribacter nigricans DSM 23189 = NBRC 102662]
MQLKIDIHQLLFGLFCLYGFLLPFEYILEFWLGIDTILKPYRIVNLFIIGVFIVKFFRQGIEIREDIKRDVFLYAIFAYGLVLTFFRMMTAPFALGYFLNDLFQSGLYLLAFFIFKTLALDDRQMILVFRSFALGLVLNSAYMFYNFVLVGRGTRDAGFMDNPNYAALGLVAIMTFFLLKMDRARSLLRRLGYGGLLLFLLYVFIITGSRTGLILLILAVAIAFFFISFRNKVGLIVAGSALLVLLIPRNNEALDLGGPLVLVNRVMESFDSDEEDVRFVIWRGTIRALEETGYVGMGIGQYKANFSSFFSQESNKLILEVVNRGYHLSTHNDYLAILTEYGMPGLFLYLIFLFQSVRSRVQELFRPYATETGHLLRIFSFILLAVIILFGMAAENFQNQLFWFLLMVATKTSIPDVQAED